MRHRLVRKRSEVFAHRESPAGRCLRKGHRWRGLAVRDAHSPWQFATGFGAHDPDRKRKLLLHRDQIDELMGKTQQQSLTLIPISLYFRDGKAKVALALARGRKLHDKRQVIAARDAEREAARILRHGNPWV